MLEGEYGMKDVVVGVSASGMTPFVRGALNRARHAGAKVIFVTCYAGTELLVWLGAGGGYLGQLGLRDA
jgi:N-acetylmuramic acid 6-phosphate (MurNAc-6-P) etherase